MTVPHGPATSVVSTSLNVEVRISQITYRLEHPGETEVAKLPRHPLNTLRRDERSVSRTRELRRLGVGHGEAGSLASDPVARVVTIPIHHVHLDAGIEKVPDGLQEPPVDDVEGALKGRTDRVRGLGEIDRHAQRREDRLLHEVAIHVGRREGVVLGVCDVVPAGTG